MAVLVQAAQLRRVGPACCAMAVRVQGGTVAHDGDLVSGHEPGVDAVVDALRGDDTVQRADLAFVHAGLVRPGVQERCHARLGQ